MSNAESDALVTRWTTHTLLPHTNVFSQQIDSRIFDFHCEPAAAGTFVTAIENVKEKRRAVQEIWRIAHYDTLIGLVNRFHFQQRLERDLEKAVECGSELILLTIDLDLFKEVNDTLGYSIGDLLLCEIQLIDSVKTQAIVSAVSQIARELEIELVAEGVETHEQLVFLALKNVFLIQGFLFSPPKPLEELTPPLESWQDSFKTRNLG
jgi:predicted signal transduction protein with EAL and GGDEF domain